MKKKIRILTILNRFNLGGPTYNVIFLSKFLSSKFETKLIAGYKMNSEESSIYLLRKYKIKFEQIKKLGRNISLINDIISFFQIIKYIKKYKPHIIHTHAAKSGFLGRCAAFFLNVPIVFHTFHGHVFHSYFNKFITNFFILLEKILASKTTKIIAISNSQKKELVKNFKIASSKKIETIKLGIDFQQIKKTT